ncbi:hypothetical protein [Chromatium okenii]|jgi:predicted chitinase/nucleoid DNA-binding protein|uniref:hypothetical protein n=1 Tax=Chromatium okenii TaxID=61644 RepID=UPI0026E9D70E|nr:hypothetical protein [Chromatium okenii]MBV5310889.1 hypothetical protein [Chromatium okenii]
MANTYSDKPNQRPVYDMSIQGVTNLTKYTRLTRKQARLVVVLLIRQYMDALLRDHRVIIFGVGAISINHHAQKYRAPKWVNVEAEKLDTEFFEPIVMNSRWNISIRTTGVTKSVLRLSRDVVKQGVSQAMEAVDRKYFFRQYRSYFGQLFQEQVDGINFLLDKMEHDERLTKATAAYIFATILHETGERMIPIRELGDEHYFINRYDINTRFSNRVALILRMGNTEIGDGMKYRGAGYVQITWKDNYRRLGKLLGVDLVNHPEKALEPEIAYEIIVRGMLEGLFTGRRLDEFITADNQNFIKARHTVNGSDCAKEIGRKARLMYNVLRTAPAPMHGATA